MSQTTSSARFHSPFLVPFSMLAVAAIFTAPTLSWGDDSTPRSRDYARVVPPTGAATPRPPQIELPSKKPSNPQAVAPPEYLPPRRGAPRATVSGGVRGTRALPTPLALAPSHLAQTVAGRPSLFWYIDAVPNQSSGLVFTLIDEEGIDPVAEVTLTSPQQAGIHRIRLADHGVSLEPGTEYEWSIALVVDSEHRAKDVVTAGYIRRVSQPEELELRQPCVTSYADLGLWYDALESVSDSIDAAPGDLALLGQRNSLLRQVGLDAVIE